MNEVSWFHSSYVSDVFGREVLYNEKVECQPYVTDRELSRSIQAFAASSHSHGNIAVGYALPSMTFVGSGYGVHNLVCLLSVDDVFSNMHLCHTMHTQLFGGVPF